MRLRYLQLLLSIAILVGVMYSLSAQTGSAQDAKVSPQPRSSRLISVPLQRLFAKAVDVRLKTLYRQPEDLVKQADRDCFELCLTTSIFPSHDASVVDPSIPDKFERLCYNGEALGRTIRVKRGQEFSVCLTNKLIADGPSNSRTLVPEGEKPHDLGITNLHTHGLHISPDGDSDNVFQAVAPGGSFRFKYHLPDFHPSGTFWYHPHKHGSVAYQLSNGLSGALIVEGDPNDPRDLESIPEIAAASTHGHQNETENHERIVLLQLFTYRVGAGVGRIDASQIYNILPDSKGTAAIDVTGPDPLSPPLQLTAINSLINPTFTIAPGEVQRWRIIHAGWDLLRRLVWVDENNKPTNEIQFNEIAIDGLATGTMSAKTAEVPLEVAPGQRSDALVWAAPTLTKGKTYHLKQLDVPGSQATDNRATSEMFLAKLVVDGNPQAMKLPDLSDAATVSKLAGCRPFKPVEDKELVASSCTDGTVNGVLNFLGSDDIQTYTINGQTFHQLRPIELDIGTAQEWKIVALLGNHPFHIHVNPFQVVAHTDAAGTTTKIDNTWRDTLYVQQGESYTIRSRFNDYIGESVLHCHILDHEDQGMMMCLRFQDPKRPNAPFKGPGCDVQSLIGCKPTARTLLLPDARGKQHELSEFKERNVVLVFFRGLGCPHCTEQLRRLLTEARTSSGFNAEIVAVSSEPVSTEAEAQNTLGLLASDRFHLLIDEDHDAFQDFGCQESKNPKHGLFLIDRDGLVRAGYTGDAPFRNIQEVMRRVLALGLLSDKSAAD